MGAVLWVSAFLLRLSQVHLAGGVGAVMENDDGVYLGAALRTVGGSRPYRDFDFVHPPGIIYLLAPFAGLAELVGEPMAMHAARIAIAAVGATTTLLIYLTVAHVDARAGLLAGACYAVGAGALSGERTVMLEPVLSFCLIASIYWLGNSGRRQMLSGGLVGLAAVTKLWMLPIAPILLYVVWRRHGRVAATRWLAAALVTVTVLVLPAVVLAGSGFFDQVFAYQFDRARAWHGWVPRAAHLAVVGDITRLIGLDEQRGLAAIAVVLFLLSLVALWSSEGRIWAILTLATTAVVMSGPAFFDHYAAFVAAPQAIALGFAAAGPLARLLRVAVPATLVVIALAAAVHVVRAADGPVVPDDRLRAAVGDEQCVWTRTASLAIALDRERSECAGALDDYARVLATGGGTGTGDEFRLSQPYQEQTIDDFSRADIAVLAPGDTDRWTPATMAAFDERFPVIELVEAYQVRRQAADGS